VEDLRVLIQKADDDYLAGLSNKGTVKRAYKDLEQETPVLTWQKEEAQVALRDATCVICAPLGESRCSCPSRNICRHVVTAILWIKQELEQDPKAEENSSEESGKAMEEILSFPAERLKRACGSGRFRTFLAHIRAGELPPIEERSIVTVTLPWENATVKLLEPFDYSTCTCHSRELCPHKAQAALAYQIKKGRTALKDLERMQEAEETWDVELVARTGRKVCEALMRQACTGLSRQSREVTGELERLAVLSHRAKLPKLENGLRELAGEYEQCFSRSAAFRQRELLSKFLQLYGRAGKLADAESQEEIRPLSGNFRDTYEPVGKLHLAAMGGRTFSSKTGYEGETYYFLETEKKQWYTWTDARPVFYEGVRRRPLAGAEQNQAPWGLNCSREQMQELEFDLTGAKAASKGRLSASQDTKAEITGVRSFEEDAIWQMIRWDYEKLLKEYETKAWKGKRDEGQEKLALVGAVRWENTEFDPIRQRFSWCIYDTMGRKLFVSIKYTKEEQLTIRLLERLEQRLRKRPQGNIVFFGSLYLDEESRLCLFPIEFFLKDTKKGEEINEPAASEEEIRLFPDAVKTLSQYCREAAGQLSDLFISGFDSVSDDVLDQMEILGEDAKHLGLHGAAGELRHISGLLRGKRHQMEFSPGPVLEAMERLEQYLSVCQEKISWDLALLSMRDTKSQTEKEKFI